MTTITIKLSTGKVVELTKDEKDELISALADRSSGGFHPLMQPYIPLRAPLEPIYRPDDIICSSDQLSTRD